MKYFLGMDCGGTVIKAGLYDVEGNEAASAGELIDIITPFEGWVERDAAQLKEATFRLIKSIIEKSGVDGADIAAVSLTGQGGGLYLFDENGEATYNPLLSGDTRAKDYVKKLYAEGTVEKVFKPKIYQSIWPGQPVVILAWFKDHKPEVLERTKYAVGCKDYLRFLLTGEWALELSESSLWGFMDIFTGEFDDELMDAAGISQFRHLLPKVMQSTDVCGAITKDAAGLTGLAEGTPVMGGMLDLTACTTGTIASDIDKLSIVTGSCSVNQYVDTEISKEVELFACTRYFIPGCYLLSDNSYTAASNLEWFIDRFMHEEKAEAEAKGYSIYKTVNDMVASVDTRDCSLFFLPFLFWSNTNIDAKGTFVGLTSYHTKAHMLRAIFEGVVFSHHYHLDKIFRIKPKEYFSAARIAGGGAKSALWVQMFADIIGIPMELSASDELGTLGTAIGAAVGSGYYEDTAEAAARFIKIKETVYPNEDLKDFYQEKYSMYKKIIGSLDGLWADISGLSSAK